MFILPQEYWEVKNTAAKGRGIFAKKDIEAGTVIGDYIGKLVSSEYQSDDKMGHYWMWLNENYSALADPSSIGVHLINHSCTPNIDTDYFQGHALYFASRRIFSNEELLMDYMLEPPEKGEVCNHICSCQSPLCRGTFHASEERIIQWEKYVEERQGDYYGKELGEIGTDLLPLTQYPEEIHDNPIYNLWGAEKEYHQLAISNELNINDLRSSLRKTGKKLHLVNQKIIVNGFINGMMVCSDFHN